MTNLVSRWSAQCSGEVLHAQSDIVGTSADRVNCTTIEKQTNHSPVTWATIASLSMTAQHCRFHYVTTGVDANSRICTNPINSVSCQEALLKHFVTHGRTTGLLILALTGSVLAVGIAGATAGSSSGETTSVDPEIVLNSGRTKY